MEQQSKKRGLQSDAQKQQRAREGYDPIPPANPVAGAFGEHKPDRTTDQDASLATQRYKKDEKAP
jgi:hypothetical protein